jgi:hypothetical protein
MTKDWVEESKTLAAELRIVGLQESEKEILEAIFSGSTGTEILMGVRWNLNKVLKEHPELSQGIQKRIREINQGITTALG